VQSVVITDFCYSCRFIRIANLDGAAYSFFVEQTKATLQKATWTTAFRRVDWDFRAAFWTESYCANHLIGDFLVNPRLLLRKIPPKVTLELQQAFRHDYRGPEAQRRFSVAA
jgi:hypothetical protein